MPPPPAALILDPAGAFPAGFPPAVSATRGAPRLRYSRQHVASALPGVTHWRRAFFTYAQCCSRIISPVRPSPGPRTRRVSGAWIRPCRSSSRSGGPDG
ncbi:hypothetical protein NDU88_001712 [Pleurodeles waltl]|uniref:Uncharacterized protein n=1 Tax=Pleurodeles waltl TaxID=8319 RepID=A0AAV7WJ90_PLEWA|nr:hypothetical protein NDU88_001712 [Pleurodeles waltl]